MRLQALSVIHLHKTKVKASEFSFPKGSAFHLDTCQRSLWVFNSEGLAEPFNEVDFKADGCGIEIFQGLNAYLFLLRTAAGLESEVLGETDVFGQFKDAWRKAERLGNAFCLDLAPWIQRVFEDTKEIRTRYLHHLGGSSYGSLVRKLIKNQVSKRSISLIGAGKIAQSVAPFLLDSELWLWNRDSSRLAVIYRELLARSHHGVLNFNPMSNDSPSQLEEEKVWRDAAHIVVCIPLDEERDVQRLAWFKKGGLENRSIVHLGGMKKSCGLWNSLPQFYCLDDVFALQNSLGNVRSVQITQAERACEERAKLRALGVSLSIPHGWEDLACFA